MCSPQVGRVAQFSLATAVLSLVAGCTEPNPTPTEDQDAVAAAVSTAAAGDRYIVILKDGNERLRATSVGTDLARVGGRIERSHNDIGVLSVRGLTAATAGQVARQADVEAVVKDRTVQWVKPVVRRQRSGKSLGLGARTNQRGAAFFDQFQWNLKRIKAQKAWNVSTQGEGVTICILDTGVDPRHIDLEGKLDVDVSASFVGNERADRDFFSHGTDMASVASSNGVGMASVSPDSRICSVKVLDRTGSGDFSDVIAGIMYVGTIGGIDVANMSLGVVLPANDPDVRALRRALQRAVNSSTNRGVLFVAASGNDAVNLNDPSVINLPSQLDNVISVGATGPIGQRQFDRVASYSNFGSVGVDVYAPGGEFQFPDNVDEDLIVAACSASFRVGGVQPCSTGDQYFLEAGTSPSAAHVSGQAAVIEAQLPGNQTPAQLTACILRSADALPQPAITANGRINVFESLGC
jgi:lantibiotic leader peptide-processing serine protease